MRCQRCQLENIPGQKTCIKCGSILQSDGTVINVYPPRMAFWKKPFRGISRWLRRQGIPADITRQFVLPWWAKTILQDSVIGLFFSIVPGLAHLLAKRFKEIRWYFMAWLILLLSGLFFYNSTIASMLIASAIGVHVWIALQYGFIKQLGVFAHRVLAALVVFAALALIYWYLPGLILPNFTTGYISFDIPYRNIKQGDFFLVHRYISRQHLIPRGSLVLIRPAAIGYHNVTHSDYTMVGQVVAVASEKVEIKEGAFIIDGQKLDPAKYPVPTWLRGRKISVNIGSNSYFISTDYSVHIHGARLGDAQVRTVCVVNADDIEGRAFMLWWPLSRRGFVRQIDG